MEVSTFRNSKLKTRNPNIKVSPFNAQVLYIGNFLQVYIKYFREHIKENYSIIFTFYFTWYLLNKWIYKNILYINFFEYIYFIEYKYYSMSASQWMHMDPRSYNLTASKSWRRKAYVTDWLTPFASSFFFQLTHSMLLLIMIIGSSFYKNTRWITVQWSAAIGIFCSSNAGDLALVESQTPRTLRKTTWTSSPMSPMVSEKFCFSFCFCCDFINLAISLKKTVAYVAANNL